MSKPTREQDNWPDFKTRFVQKESHILVKIIIVHPMHSGERQDHRTLKLIPADFLTAVHFFAAGKEIMKIAMGPHVSSNPYFAFHIATVAEGTPFRIETVDNGKRRQVFDTLVTFRSSSAPTGGP